MQAVGRTKDAKWGFTALEPGTYTVEIQEGIEKKISEDGSRTNLYIPTKVCEGPRDGAPIAIFCDQANKYGEQRVADVVACSGMWDKFAANFPDDASFFDKQVVDAMKVKLVGKRIDVRLEASVSKKDGKTYTNPVEIFPAGEGVKEEDGKATAKKEAAKPAAKAAADANWD